MLASAQMPTKRFSFSVYAWEKWREREDMRQSRSRAPRKGEFLKSLRSGSFSHRTMDSM